MNWWWRVLGRKRFEKQLDAELRYHYERLIADNLRRGMSEPEARRAARLEFGGVDQLKEDCRDARGWLWVERSLHDIRLAARSLLKTPAFTLLVVVVLALGIGTTTAIFSVMNAVLLRPLNYPQQERLYEISGMSAKGEATQILPGAFEIIRQRGQTLERSTLIRVRNFTIVGEEGAESIVGQAFAGDGLRVFGTTPLLGRYFSPGATAEVVLSQGLWMRRYQRDEGVIGRSITLNNEAYTVVGVMPPGFESTHPLFEIWLPWRFSAEELAERRGRGFQMVVRREASASEERMSAELAALGQGFASALPTEERTWKTISTQLKEHRVGKYRKTLWLLLGAVGFVLLIACLNTACLMLVRTLGQMKEVAVRLALGAPRSRVIHQFLMESMVLSLAGGLVGLLLAWGGTRAIINLSSAAPILPRIDQAGVDGRVLLFVLAVSLLAGLAFGIVPAWQVSRVSLQGALKESGRGFAGNRSSQFARGVAVSLQVALSLVLLSGAGLLLRTFVNLVHTDPGFHPEGVLTARVPVPTGTGNQTNSADTYAGILGRARAIPGIQVVGLTTVLPLGPLFASTKMALEGRHTAPEQRETVQYRSVSPDYFGAMGIPMLQGRLFEEGDTENAPGAAIVNDVAARKYWPGENPLGKRVATSFDGGQPQWVTVVGVVGGVRQFSLGSKPTEELYRPHTQHFWVGHNTMLVMRTNGDPRLVIEPLRRLLREEFPFQPVAEIRTMVEWVERSVTRPRFDMMLLGVFALIALTVAAMGVYGLIAYGVRQRRREIGIRMVMGATSRDVSRRVIGQGFRVVAPGLMLGIAGALALTRLLSAELYGVEPNDPLTLTVASALLLGTGLVACWGPARRATKVNPVETLHDE